MIGRPAHVAGALFISWMVALTATHLNLLYVQVCGTAVCAMIAICQRSLVGNLVAILFVPKLIVYAMHSEGFWIFADVENPNPL